MLLKLRDGKKMQAHREMEKIKASLSNEKVREHPQQVFILCIKSAFSGA